MNKVINRIWEFWWVGILLIIAPCLIKAKVPDSDTFFLIATGKNIVETGMVPTINPFVIHEEFSMIVQQWLFDVIIYSVYNAFSNSGIFVFVLAAYTMSITLLYKYLSLFSQNKIAKGIIMLICGFLYISFGVARPTCISFIVMIFLLYCIEKYRKTNKLIYLVFLPILSLLEINIHSAMWPMIFVLMLPYVFPYTLIQKGYIKVKTKQWFNRNKYLLLIMPIMMVMGLINPNGIKGITYIINSYGSANNGLSILELLPPNTNSLMGIIIMIAIAFFSIYLYKNKTKLLDSSNDIQNEFAKLSLAAGVLILACTHLRNAWYLIIGTTPIILTVIGDFKIKCKKARSITTFRKIEFTAIAMVLTIFFSYFMLSISSFSAITTKDSELAPIKAAEYLEKYEKKDIILYTEFNNGAYMELQGYKVYIDARPELFEKKINGKEDVYTEYCKVKKGDADFEKFLNKYKFTHMIVLDNTLLELYLSLSDEYVPMVCGTGYTLYELK